MIEIEEKIRKVEMLSIGNDTEVLRDGLFDPDDILMYIVFYELGLGASIDHYSYEMITFVIDTETGKLKTTISGSMFAMNNCRIFLEHWMKIQKAYNDSQICDFLAEPDSPVRSELRELLINETKAKLALLNFANIRPEFRKMARLPKEQFIMLWDDLMNGDEETIEVVEDLVK